MKQPQYLVAGLGKTGQSIARYLQRRDLDFIAYDSRPNPPDADKFRAEFPTVELFLAEFPAERLQGLQAIITSPGLALDTPLFRAAFAAGLVVYGDIECLARSLRVPVIAITGTNGKSTVTSLVGEMAREAGICTAVAGNIGTPVLDLLDDGQDYQLWVLELSSFQLELTHSLNPLAATILNVTEDHLDRHHIMEAYIAAKQRIYQRCRNILFNRQDPHTSPNPDLFTRTPSTLLSFGIDQPENEADWGIIEVDNECYLAHGSRALMPVTDMQLKGVHNWQNALAAMALATAAGVSEEACIRVLQRFSALPHRCQWIRTLNGVEYIDDSKGTNIGATQSAIAGIGGAMQGKIVLIAGGQGKGADFTEMRSSMNGYVRSVVLIGEDADKIEAAWSGVVPMLRADSMDKAVHLAKAEAKPGDVVLLSPACASLDMFKDYNHRGEVFADIVNGLPS